MTRTVDPPTVVSIAIACIGATAAGAAARGGEEGEGSPDEGESEGEAVIPCCRLSSCLVP